MTLRRSVVSSSRVAPPDSAPVPDVLTSVVARVLERLRLREAGSHDGDTGASTIILGLMLDELFKQHFQGDFTLEKLPEDQLFAELFGDVVKEVKAEMPQLHDALVETDDTDFKPQVRKVLEILYESFDKLPQLAEIPAPHRWRFLIDPVQIDGLKKLGIDTQKNPLLAFVFDTEGPYSHSLAMAAKAAFSDLGEPFDLMTLRKIAHGGSMVPGYFAPYYRVEVGFGTLFGTEGFLLSHGRPPSWRRREIIPGWDLVHGFPAGGTGRAGFGAYFSEGGIERVAACMRRLAKDYEMTCTFVYEPAAKAYRVTPDGAYVAKAPGLRPLSLEDMQPVAENANVMEILGMPECGEEVRHQCFFLRELAAAKTLSKAMESVISRYHEICEAEGASPQDKLEAAVDVYLEGETLHAFKNGNFRLWGILILNRLLAQQGLPMTTLYNPDISDGSSRKEVVHQVIEGQEYWRKLRAPADA